MNIAHLGCDKPEYPGVLIEVNDNTPIKAAYWVEYDHFILIDSPGSDNYMSEVRTMDLSSLGNLLKPLRWLNGLMQSKGMPSLVGSASTRQWVAARLFYQDSSQKSDILDPNKTQTQLIAALQYLIKLGHHIELTAVNSDHHDDSALCVSGSPYCGTHHHGWAVDCWPLNTATAGDWVDASTHDFRQFLVDIAKCPFYMQTGLVGNGPNDPANYADSPANFHAAGPGAFQDDGGPHVHIGTKTS